MVNIILLKSSLFFCTLHFIFNFNFNWQNNILIYITRIFGLYNPIQYILNHWTIKNYELIDRLVIGTNILLEIFCMFYLPNIYLQILITILMFSNYLLKLYRNTNHHLITHFTTSIINIILIIYA
jgi:hypothetical protein